MHINLLLNTVHIILYATLTLNNSLKNSLYFYADYVIPKGCFVVPFLSAVHLDENVYNDALAFNPWRWMDGKNQVRLYSSSILLHTDMKIVHYHLITISNVK